MNEITDRNAAKNDRKKRSVFRHHAVSSFKADTPPAKTFLNEREEERKKCGKRKRKMKLQLSVEEKKQLEN